jgi:hypothetical protein
VAGSAGVMVQVPLAKVCDAMVNIKNILGEKGEAS